MHQSEITCLADQTTHSVTLMNEYSQYFFVLVRFNSFPSKMIQAGYKNEKTVHMHLPPLSSDTPPRSLFTQSVQVLNISSVY